MILAYLRLQGSDVLEILELAQESLESGEAITVNEKIQRKEAIEKSYFVHETAVVDAPCTIGENTKIWHYSHVQKKMQLLVKIASWDKM